MIDRADSGPAVSLAIDPKSFQQLITAIVQQVVQDLDSARATVGEDRIGYSEAEAAALLGLESHVLRDERRRGKIRAFLIVGRRVRYSREDLVDYLTREPWTEQAARHWTSRKAVDLGNGQRLPLGK
jgi:hypothetical protein